MTDVRKLLDESTPLPWNGVSHICRHGHRAQFFKDSDLLLYAVNHLPDYEAAVDAAQRVMDSLNPHDEYPTKITDLDALGDLYAILRRLREES